MKHNMLRWMAIAAVVSIVTVVCGPTVTTAESLFKPIPTGKIDKQELSKAESITQALLKKWEKGVFEPISDDFTELMQQKLDPDTQKLAYEDIKSKFGTYKSMKFVEAVKSDRPRFADFIIYRFRGTFTMDKRPEIRVVMDSQGKIAGFWIKYWKKEVS